MSGLMIGTGVGSLFGLSLIIPLGYPLESTNPGADLPVMMLDAPSRLWFGSDVVWG